MSFRKNFFPASLHVARVTKSIEPGRKYGKAAPSERVVQLEDYLDFSALPTTPVNWAAKLPASLGMYLNDRIGDCTCAAVAHAIQIFTGNNRGEVSPLVRSVLRMYEAVSGYDPYTGRNDNGAVETDVLERWRTVGLTSRHRISAYARFDHTDVEKVKQVIATFGLAYVGLQVPQDWEYAPDVWAVSNSPIVGGHAVILVGWNTQGPLLISWGRVFQMTWAAWSTYADEAYAIVSNEWVGASGVSPSGLNLSQLVSDLNALNS